MRGGGSRSDVPGRECNEHECNEFRVENPSCRSSYSVDAGAPSEFPLWKRPGYRTPLATRGACEFSRGSRISRVLTVASTASVSSFCNRETARSRRTELRFRYRNLSSGTDAPLGNPLRNLFGILSESVLTAARARRRRGALTTTRRWRRCRLWSA